MKRETPRSRLSIAVVDADRAVSESLAATLQLLGHDVHCFPLASAFRESECYVRSDRIICEAELPDESGVALFRQMLALGIDTPFALLLSTRLAAHMRRGRSAGVAHFLVKPLTDPEPLMRFLENTPPDQPDR